MNYTEIQLEAIRLFGKKDLKSGSLLLISADKDCDELYSIGDDLYGNTSPKTFPINISEKEIEFMQDYGDSGSNYFKRKVIGILGHIPYLEDLFRIATEKGFIYILQNISLSRYELGFNNGDKKTYIEYKPSLPLLDQPSLPEIISLFR